MNITILGNVCIDRNTSENSHYTGIGGPPSFMHKILLQFPEVHTEIIAPYGEDFMEYSTQLPLKNGPTSTKTLVYENITKSGKRTQKAFNLSDARFDKLRFPSSEADLIVIAPLHPFLSINEIKGLLPTEKTVPVVLLPQGYFRSFDENNTVLTREFEEALEILPVIDFVILSEQDHPNSFDIARQWSDSHNVTVIITQGERGAAILEPQKATYEIGTTPVNEKDIVDSVGSGDIFSISFAYKYTLTRDIESAISFANSIARQCLFFDSENIKIDIAAAE